MTPEQRRENSRKGGLATAASGNLDTETMRAVYAASFASEEERREHYREIGRKGGTSPRRMGAHPRRVGPRRREVADPIEALMKAVFGPETRIRWSVPAHLIARVKR